MDIKISPRENSSITKEVEFELGEYTIFAGENNTGKTNLMEALMDKLPKDQVIYIPAESVKVEEHIKTTAKEDPMRDAFLKLIDVSIGELPTVNYEIVENFLDKISKTFDSFGVTKIKLDLGIKRLTESDIKKILKDEISKKILNSVIRDSYGIGCNLKIEEVGQGTQRLIIAAILQELSKANVQAAEFFLVFEEPEIYLHPRLKRNLYNALFDISKKHSMSVILTTHDPYFIELGVGQKIYNVTRDADGATVVKRPPDGILDSQTYAEVNYIIFDVPSTDYLLQLYQKACEIPVKDFEKYQIDGIAVCDIRGALTHRTSSFGRKNALQPNVTEDIKKKTIDYLRNVLVPNSRD